MVGGGNTDNFVEFLHKHGLDKAVNPVYAALADFNLPFDGKSVILHTWQKFFMDHTWLRAIKLFQRADKIEKKNAELQREEGHIPP